MSKARDTADLNNGIDVDASGNVGIGVVPNSNWRTTFDLQALQIGQSGSLFNLDPSSSDRRLYLTSNAYLNASGDFVRLLDGYSTAYQQTDGSHLWSTAASSTAGSTVPLSEAMRIDSSGNLLVGQSSSTQPGVGNTTNGFAIRNDGLFFSSAYQGRTGTFGRNGNDGPILGFYKDGSSVGSIGVSSGDLLVSSSGSNPVRLQYNGNSVALVNSSNFGPANDNFQDLGSAFIRWDDIYASNGTIQTSDRNEKQDIEALSDAEQRVAVACKGLLRKFRWIDAVAEKGDDARIHFGIIAQDLQDAFAAEGLDAGRYAMFISSTWWETQTEVPAVDAVAEVLDEDGNVVTEAVEAKDAYTRTDTYETLEEAPEGATERTRLGVRYPELLAFIIGAM